jgi:hypothetical protein
MRDSQRRRSIKTNGAAALVPSASPLARKPRSRFHCATKLHNLENKRVCQIGRTLLKSLQVRAEDRTGNDLPQARRPAARTSAARFPSFPGLRRATPRLRSFAAAPTCRSVSEVCFAIPLQRPESRVCLTGTFCRFALRVRFTGSLQRFAHKFASQALFRNLLHSVSRRQSARDRWPHARPSRIIIKKPKETK